MAAMTHGVLAEFQGAERLLAAARELRAQGYRELDAFTPFPVNGMEEVLGLRRSRLTLMAGAAGAFGAGFAFWLQWLLVGRLYPLDVGGRPPFAIPAFVIIAFETMILFASVGVFLLFFWICRLPRLAHPLFAVDGFEGVTVDGFWLGVNARDERFDPDRTVQALRALGAARVELAGGPA
jgi:hypothetical protein